MIHRALQLPQFDPSAVPHDPGGGILGVDKGYCAQYLPVDPHEHVPAREVGRDEPLGFPVWEVS